MWLRERGHTQLSTVLRVLSCGSEWVWWFNYHRPLEPIGYIPPVEYEEAYYRPQAAQADTRTLKQTYLR